MTKTVMTMIRVRLLGIYSLLVDIQQIDLKLSNMMQVMNDFAHNFQSSMGASQRPQSSETGPVFARPGSQGVKASGMLTTHVWPKSRMLFAVVSKMTKEGLLNP